MAVFAGKQRAMYVGPICDECARTHMAPYVVTDEGANAAQRELDRARRQMDHERNGGEAF
jgi:hypothetical protein